MSAPTTEDRCVYCIDLPRKCDACEDSVVNGSTSDISHGGINGSTSVVSHAMSDTRSWTFDELAEIVYRKLKHQGYCVVDKFHKEDNALAILSEVKKIHGDGLMHNGQLTSSVASSNIRGDQIAWIDGKEQRFQNICFHMRRVDGLLRLLNNKITHYNVQGRTQAMVACYPGQGKRYIKHVDNPHRDGRCITTLYYLNKDYDASTDGGELRLYPGAGSGFIDIEPILDRFLIFWSDTRNPHEVLPAYSTRYAITLWYFDQEERQAERERQEKLKILQGHTKVTEKTTMSKSLN